MKKIVFLSCILILLCSLGSAQVFTQFSSGNVVVLQAGNGATALSSTATPMFLREISPSGSSLFTYTVPVTSNTLTMSGSATSEGGLTLSADNKKLILVGYNAAVGTTGIASTAGTAANRVVAAVDATAGITYTGTSSYYSGNNIRCGASDGLGNYWTVGANTGLCYMGTLSAAAITQTISTNLRSTQIFMNELYFSTGSGTSGIYKVGSSLPVTAGQTTTLIINTSTVGTSPSPYGFYFNSAMTICYIADDRATTSGGGIQKWVNSLGTWTLAYTFSTSATPNTTGARAVIADFSGTNPIIYGTSAESSLNRLFKIIDGGSVAGSTISTIATASTNTIFRGIAFSPTLSTCTTASITSATSNTNVCSSQSLNLNVTAAGSAPFTYNWSGPGSLSSNTVSSPNLASPVSGNYTITVSNGCGTASAAISISVNPAVTLAVSPATICSGSTTNLNASGASTYTWNNGSNLASISVSPSVTTVYTVTGKSAQGCPGSQTVNVNVNGLPTIAVTTSSICSGNQATLAASGADSYTWNTGSNSPSLVLNPTSTTNYTIIGTDANNCINSASTSIIVVASPTISVISSNICAGQMGTLSANGAVNYTWSTAATTSVINDSPLSTTVYTVIGAAGGCLTAGNGTLTVIALPILSVNSETICSGESATLSVNGASTYTWNSSSYSSSISVSPTVNTIYTVSGTSSLNCVSTVTTQIIVNAIPVITANSASLCVGDSAMLTANGATTYSWNTGSTSNSIVVTPNTTSVYTITGTSASCDAGNTVTVTVNPLPTINVPGSSICSGGSSTLTASGAATYTWNTGSTNPSITASPTANTNYTVSGTSAFGCINTSTTSITVSASPSIAATSVSTCAGSQATLIASGVNTYTWNNGANTSSIVITPASSGIYTVSGNASGCAVIVTNTLNVTLNPLPTLTVNSATVCAGSSATLVAAGAASYNWNTGSNINTISPSPSITTTYSVIGTSSLGCSNSTTVIVAVNPLPTISVNDATICLGTSASLTASGANTYTWNTAATTTAIVVAPITTSVYTISGSASGCSSSAITTVVVNPLPTLSSTSATICTGNSATLTVGGATSYSWSNGMSTAAIAVNPAISTIYSVTGVSSLGCSNTTTAQVVVNSLPVLTLNSATICVGSSTMLSVSGAASYSWNTGSTASSVSLSPSITTIYTVSGTSSLNCVSSATSQVMVNAIPLITANSATVCAGTSATLMANGAATYSWNTGSTNNSIVVTPSATSVYTISGTSAACNGGNTATVTVNPLPTINVPASSICSGGSSTLTASGAATYTWNTGSNSPSITATPTANTNYTISGTSAFGCINTNTTSITISTSPSITVNSVSICAGSQATLIASGVNTYTWNNGATTSNIVVTPTTSGIYTVSGNASGCAVVVTNTLYVTLNTLPLLSVNSTSICAGIPAMLTASGANTYSWNTGAVTASVNLSPSVTTIYTVTGISAQGCATSSTAQIIVSSNPTISVTSATICSGNSATLIASGASSYSWNTGATSSLIVVSPANNASYTLTGTSSGCTSIAVSSIAVNNQPTVTASSATICAGSIATLSANGATTYSWSTSSNATNISVSPTLNTTYTLSGTSAQGCTNTALGQVIVYSLPTLTINTPTICSGNPAILTVSGASTYVWSTSATGTSISTSSLTTPTIYTVTGTSSLTCVASITTQISIIANPTVTINSPTICSGSSTTLSASGANTYSWNTSSTSTSIVVSPTSSIVYSVTGTILGCSTTATTSVSTYSLPAISVNSLNICNGGNGTLTAIGANSYTWNTSSTSASIVANPSVTTNYTVTGTAATGCINSATTTVAVSSSPVILVNSATVCSGSSVILLASGVNSYTWNNGSNGSSITVTPATSTVYSVFGNASGCAVTASTTASVNVIALPALIAPSTSICIGNSAILNVSGATSYTWNTGSNSNQLTVSPTASTIYSVVGTQNGCLNTTTTAVLVYNLPAVTISGSTVICQGSSVTLVAAGALNYNWTSGPNSSNYSVSPNTTATYSVIGNSAEGCTNTAIVTVMVNSLPSVSLSVDKSLLCITDNTLSLSGSPIGGSYTGTAVNGNYFDPAIAGVGIYTLTYNYTDSHNCSGSSNQAITVDLCTGILETDLPFVISIYPNPAVTELCIKNPSFAANYMIEIYDIAGKQVLLLNSNQAVNTLSLSNLANGIYLLRVTEAYKTANLKFIKD